MIKDIVNSIRTACGLVTKTINAIDPLVDALNDCTSTVQLHSGEMKSQTAFDIQKASAERIASQQIYEAQLKQMIED